MSSNREEDLWQEIGRRDVLLVGLAIITAIILYFVLASPTKAEFWDTARQLAMESIANLIPVGIAFMASYILLSRIQSLRSERDTEELVSRVSAELRQIVKDELRGIILTPGVREEQRDGQETQTKSSRLVIRTAEYGAKTITEDVTEIVRSKVTNDSIKMPVSNAVLECDPFPGIGKTLTVEYSYDGEENTIRVKEGEPLILPPME